MKLKKIISSVTAMLCSIAIMSTAEARDYLQVPSWLADYGNATYQTARAYFGRGSFSGYCGTYVRCQLKAMGIFSGDYDFRGNGNQWYDGFKNVYSTSGGYHVYSESGGDCINKLVAKYGNDLRNIVVSFPIQSHHTASNPGAGHAFVIYALIDGIAYYSESFAMGEFAEGQVIAEDVNQIMQRYNQKFGNANGCVMFSANACEKINEQAAEAILSEADVSRMIEEKMAEICAENLKYGQDLAQDTKKFLNM